MNREVLLQNLPESDQFKYSCLAWTADYLWESMKARQNAISRFRISWGQPSAYPFYQTEFFSCALTSNNTKHVLQLSASVCHRRQDIMPKNNPGEQNALEEKGPLSFSRSLFHSSPRHFSACVILLAHSNVTLSVILFQCIHIFKWSVFL